ncbi:phosphonate C-P lyase system protein PhnG [Uliginosibacterium flavum]|uniref:Phosphonate C-P lyase system protein PhnG n=1 Tax=Uliginosibacterium flavum TaxID=1396831 RepID=A0ABV2TLR8_9RHOO
MTDYTDRRSALGLLARSPAGLLAERFAALNETPAFTWLRRPETGMVMLRARIGGDGAQFNLGEATLTRCTLRLADGTVGVGTVRGRSARQAEMIALCDALLQQPESAARVHAEVITALATAEQARQQQRATEVAASRVDFFTLVRGED